MATRIDGKALAAKVKAEVAVEAEQLSRRPGLAVILVGNDPASRVYVNGKSGTAPSAASGVLSMLCRRIPPRRRCWD